MSDPKLKTAGRVADVFAHRFVVETNEGARVLADLGPKGATAVPLAAGDTIVLEGERTLSEIKVSSIAVNGAAPVAVQHKPKGDHEAADPRRAAVAVKAAGLEPIGAPRRKPKHFEVLARRDGLLVECHVTFDGAIRKEKPVEATDETWLSERAVAA